MDGRVSVADNESRRGRFDVDVDSRMSRNVFVWVGWTCSREQWQCAVDMTELGTESGIYCWNR